MQSLDQPRMTWRPGLRLENYRAIWRGSDIGLTMMQFHIVDALNRRRGEFLTYHEIYGHIRPTGFVAGDNGDVRIAVRQHMRRIRQKFVAIDPAFDRIENMAACGYRWRA